MVVNLSKGHAVELKKETITHVHAGLEWNMAEASEATADLDLFLVQRAVDGTARDSDLIFYGNKKNANGSVEVGEDNLTGEDTTDGYDEEAFVKLTELPSEVNSVIIAASIYAADKKHQTFSQINGAFCDVLNNDTSEKIAHYDMSTEMGDNTGIIIGEFSRDGTDWKFTAIGEGVKGGMHEIVSRYGIEVA